jgi:hypothetical protein
MNAPPILRHEDGRFLPGVSPNPSGRPKGAGAIRELARAYLPAALKKIGELIENPDPRVALAASQEIVNRVFGRPVQAIESDVKKFDMTALYLAAVKTVNGDPPASETLDVTPGLMDDVQETTEDPATVTVDW